MEDPPKQTYVYDVIMTHTTLKSMEDPSDRTFSVRLLNEFIELTDDRLYTHEFGETPLGELHVTPCDLISSLSSNGVCVAFKENGKFMGAGAEVMGPQNLIAMAEKSCEVSEDLTIRLVYNKRGLGFVTIRVAFKSIDPDLDTTHFTVGCYDICRPLDRVAAGDMMFTMGRSRTCATTTGITDERLMPPGVEKPFNYPYKPHPDDVQEKDCGCIVKGVRPPPALDDTKELERKLLKRLLNELQVDREKVPTPPWSDSKGKRCKCYESQPKSSVSEVLMPHQQMELDRLLCCPDTSTPNLTAINYKPPLRCHFCHANITWLPKLAACPYCGYVHVDLDVPSEEPFDEKATAAGVLRKHFLDNRKNEEAEEYQPRTRTEQFNEPSKECTCNKTRICTKCQLKQLSDEMLKVKARKIEPLNTSRPCAKNQKSPTPSEHRRKLISVLKEISNTYKVNTNADEADKICKEVKQLGIIRRAKRLKKRTLKELKNTYPRNLKKTKKKCGHRKLRSKRYTFLAPLRAPGSSGLHMRCTAGTGRVPCHMGWLWTQSELARHRCWRPGAVMKPIRQLMEYFLKDYPADTVNQARIHNRRRRRLLGLEVDPPKRVEEPLIQHPMLYITKNEDDYIITLRPLKAPDVLAKAANPFENMKPIVFRIRKDPIATGLREIRRSLREKGFPPCECKQPVAKCFCRTYLDQKVIEYEVNRLSKQRGWNDISDTFIYEDGSESDSESEKELEFGVTPPAGVIKPERLCRPDRVITPTQYDERDWAMPTALPHPPNPYVQYAGCVFGERRGRFTWILGKGEVNVDPKPPKMINKPVPKQKRRDYKPNQKPKQKPNKGKRLKGGCDVVVKPSDNVRPQKRIWHRSNQDIHTHFIHDTGLIR